MHGAAIQIIEITENIAIIAIIPIIAIKAVSRQEHVLTSSKRPDVGQRELPVPTWTSGSLQPPSTVSSH